MALKDAVLAIVEGMEEEAKEWELRNEAVWNVLRTYAKQLRIGIKASEGTEQQVKSNWSETPEAQHERMKEAARQEIRKKRTEAQTGLEPRQVLVEGIEELEGTYVPIPQDTPVGAKTKIGGKLFELREDGKLHPVGP